MQAGKCKHYNGTVNKKCEAGIVYLEIAESPEKGNWGLFKRLPCFAENGVATCDKYAEPTPEELAEWEDMISRSFQNMVTVRTAIVAHIEANGWKKQSIQSRIDCPACETGHVSYSYAGSYNGHIHARCSTSGCVNWIE